MKVGMIIVFGNDDEKLLDMNIVDTFKSLPDVFFCLVNNNCSELFGETLMDIADECENVTMIHIKKTKSNSLAVRAGSRFLNNHLNLKFLGYITELKGEDLIKAIEMFGKTKGEIRFDKRNAQSNKLIKQSFFQRIFSVSNYYEQMNLKLE